MEPIPCVLRETTGQNRELSDQVVELQQQVSRQSPVRDVTNSEVTVFSAIFTVTSTT